MISTLYRGSVKNVLGPVSACEMPAVVFEYTDAFSVFDWGKMPDLLTRKGEALAVMGAELFERLERPSTWKEFSKSSEALALRKGNRFGAMFNELGEVLQNEGLRTHYLGVMDDVRDKVGDQLGELKKLSDVGSPFRRMMVREVSVVKPSVQTILGRSVPDYENTRKSALPRLIPLEVVFRFSAPPESSIHQRVNQDAGYLASIGFPEVKLVPGKESGARWGFPVLELFTKLESSDRVLSLSEAVAISGVTVAQLQDVLLRTAWVAGLLKFICGKVGLELVDGKLEWGLQEGGQICLVDSIGLDELRIVKQNVSLSKEFLRGFYRSTSWYKSIQRAKTLAETQGISEWKRFVMDTPPALPTRYKELGTQLYLALVNELTGRRWFAEGWTLDKVVGELKTLQGGAVFQ